LNVVSGFAIEKVNHRIRNAWYRCHRLQCVQCGVLSIDHGKIIAAGTLANLRSLLAERDLLRLTGVFPPAAAGSAIEGIRFRGNSALQQRRARRRLPGADRG
jgi:hypothetical protein